MLRRALALSVIAVLVGVVLACGDSNGGGAQASTATGSTTEPGASTATTPARAARGVRLVRIGRFDSPLFVTAPPGDRRRLFVVEQPGRIVIVKNGRKLARPFLDISSQVTSGGEQGLLGLAFAPDYRKTGKFYVYYTRRDGRQTLVEYRRTSASADRANRASARRVFVHDDPEANHNGGMLAFGPDRLLYVGTGDGGGGDDQHGSRGNAQNLGSPLGKILRIDPNHDGNGFDVPRSNPFVGRSGARPEIYAYGLRNPWRFSFDRRTGDIAIGDVGQDAVEEIDFARKGRAKGRNFGWRPWEGRQRNFDEPAPGAVFPVITHTHSAGWCSITGGYVVRDRALGSLYGRYVYGDYCQGVIRSAKLQLPRAEGERPVRGLHRVSGLSSFGEDARGRVYVTSLEGAVFRIAAR
jgi:glucose/arabinose dehydrogenase